MRTWANHVHAGVEARRRPVIALQGKGRAQVHLVPQHPKLAPLVLVEWEHDGAGYFTLEPAEWLTRERADARS